MYKIIRTTSTHKDFINLVRALDSEIAIYNGEDNEFYSQFNTIDSLKHTVVAYNDSLPIACGAYKPIQLEFSEKRSVEIKRMYVLPEFRGKGAAGLLLSEIESWASELNYDSCILETGKFLKRAVALYTKSGYSVIPNYGQYKDMPESICFEKQI